MRTLDMARGGAPPSVSFFEFAARFPQFSWIETSAVMANCKNRDHVFGCPVHNPIIAVNEFAIVFSADLRHNATQIGKTLQSFCRVDQAGCPLLDGDGVIPAI